MDRIITVQRPTFTYSGSGDQIETWTDIAFQIPAGYAPTPGSERYTSAQEVAEQEVTFTIRFHSIPDAAKPLTPKDRILYPAESLAANVQSPGTKYIFDILGAEEVGRERDLRIRCRRRTDV